MKDKKCIVKDCRNKISQGNFIGDLCVPCYEFITEEKGIYSQAYQNAIKIGKERVINMIQEVNDKVNELRKSLRNLKE